MGRSKKGITDLDRFESNVFYSPDGCWYWTGYCYPSGHGSLYVKGRITGAHRLSYQFFRGDIGDLHVLHHCDNPKCVNPDHLFLGTNSDNMKDKVSKNRQWRPEGEKCPFVKITETDVITIRSLRGVETGKAVAEKFGLTIGHVFKIWWRKHWTHI